MARRLFRYLFCLKILFFLGNKVYPQSFPATLTLRVTDYQTGWPIQHVAVSVVDSSLQTQTDAEGIARFSGIQEGLHVLSLAHNRYAGKNILLTFKPGDNLDVDLALERLPIEMEGIEIVESRIDPSLERRGYYRRKASGAGKYIEREDWETRGRVLLSDALRGVAGVRIVTMDSEKVAVTMRRGSPCPLRVFVDGSRLSGGGTDPVQRDAIDLDMWPLNDIAAIEVYTGLAQIPVQYSQYNRCGVVLIWTRMGE